MAAFVRYTDPLLLTVDNAPAGRNWYDDRSLWHPLGDITFGDGGLADTQWYRDQGPIGMAPSRLEPRAFCTRGGLTLSFTGTTLILRLNTAFSWYTGAQVRVDGSLPSSLGLLTGLDTVSCDSATYGLSGDDYVDVLTLDGLAAGAHVLTILIDNDDAAQFFSIAGYRVGQLTPTILLPGHDTWLVAAASNITPNHGTLTVTNRQDVPIVDVLVTFPAGLMSDTGGALAPISVPVLNAGISSTRALAPIFTGAEESDVFLYALTVNAKYPDPDGTIPIVVTLTLEADSDLITFAPSPWFTDHSTPTDQARIYANEITVAGTPWTASFTFSGDALALTVQRSAGWSILGLYDGPTLGATLLASADCGVDDGGAIHTYSLTGFGSGSHTVWMRKSINDGLFIVFVQAQWQETANYSEVTEAQTLALPGLQPIGMPVQSVTIGTYDATFSNPSLTAHDYTSTPVRENASVSYTETMQRFPTFAVFYGSGYRDLLAEYDVLIVDPIGAKPADVLYWQSKGIKVFGYISTGQEVGFYAEPYNFSSALAPRSGSGPGGYSANYMFTLHPSAGPPDKDPVWAAYYMDPRDASGWTQRIIDYYIPQCVGGPVDVVAEVVTTLTAATSFGTGVVFSTALSPINGSAPIIVTTFDGSHTYTQFQDYTYDVKTGNFVLSPTISPPVTSGDQLKISYQRLGHDFDGIFLDTVDIPDVYSGNFPPYPFVPGYAAAFAAMIIAMSEASGVPLLSNRGFTILDDIIHVCNGVMFETWLTFPDDIDHLPTTGYHRITDQETIDINEGFNQQLRRLRQSHVFDVYSLNYALPDDVELQRYCRSMDAQRGYLSWQTIITLNQPQHNDAIAQPSPRIQTSAFVPVKYKDVVP